jgi:hypothetical protein
VDFRPKVERLFREAPDRTCKIRQNPVTGGHWVPGEDPIRPQKLLACRALVAQAWFEWAYPALPRLPLSYADREAMKRGGVPHIVAWFARSLAARGYILDGHRWFEMYASGVLASADAPWFITRDTQLKRLYPPRPLPGLDSSFYWNSAKLHS